MSEANIPGVAIEGGEAEHFRIMADNIPQLAWMADSSGWIFWYNRRWYDYTGTKLEDVAGWDWRSVHHPDHIDRVVANFRSSLESGEPWEDTFPLRDAEGAFRWFLSRAMPIRNDSGEVIRWFGTNTDITQQLQTEAALRDAEERQRLAAEAAGIGSWDYRPPTGELLWDRRCAKLMGVAPGAEVTLDTFVACLHPEDRERVAGSVAATLAPGGGPDFFDEFRTLDPETGQYRWIASRGRVTRDGDEAKRFIGTVLDVNERKVAEHNQTLLINELNHRVKNTLAMVQAMASRTLHGAKDPAQAREALTARLLALSNAHDILTAESWEGAEMEEVASRAVAPYEENPGARFELSGPRVRISPKKALALFIALHELAANAVKYGALTTDAGRVSVDWKAVQQQDGRRLRIVWREQGGPPVAPPARTGFGTRMIERGLAGQLNARVTLDYRPDGLWCTIDAPLLHVDRKTPQ